ncbi:MAG: hypothetical protein ACJAYF_000143 [Arenicella sp.]|jgi:hypothetical protein
MGALVRLRANCTKRATLYAVILSGVTKDLFQRTTLAEFIKLVVITYDRYNY